MTEAKEIAIERAWVRRRGRAADAVTHAYLRSLATGPVPAAARTARGAREQVQLAELAASVADAPARRFVASPAERLSRARARCRATARGPSSHTPLGQR